MKPNKKMKPSKKLLLHLLRIAIAMILFPCFSIYLSLFAPAQEVVRHSIAHIQATEPLASSKVEIAQRAEAINRFQILAEADQLYQSGQTEAAANLYRQVKPNVPASSSPPTTALIYETNPEQLSGAMAVFWRNALDGIAKNLDSQTFISLHSLTHDYPEFIPGHLKLAEVCQEKLEACKTYASEGQPTSAAGVLERATSLYPDEPDLLRAKVTALASADEYLQAAIAARQFSQIYIDYPEASDFADLADEYLKKYESKTRRELQATGLLNTAIGIGQAILTGDASQGISGLQTILMLGRGESKFGQETANALVKQYREQGNLIEDSEVLNYVTGIAERFTPYIGRDFEYEFYVTDENTLNAFALPGGKVFINSGAILGSSSEAELAGLLSHEISHAALSHGFQSVVQGNLLNSLQQVIPFNDFIFNFAKSQHSQEQERQADLLGTRVLAASGYAADGLRNLMATLSQREDNASQGQKSALASWLSTHPASVERVRSIERLIQDNQYNRYAYEGVEKHLEIQNRLQGNFSEPVQSPQGTPASPDQAVSVVPPTNTQPPQQQILGAVALATNQDQSNVVIRFDGAQVSRSGSFTINLVIENSSDRPFGFVPAFAKVVTNTGEELSSRLSFNIQGDTLVQPGGKLEGQLAIFGHPWQNAASQGLTFIVREGTSGGRMFRLSF